MKNKTTKVLTTFNYTIGLTASHILLKKMMVVMMMMRKNICMYKAAYLYKLKEFNDDEREEEEYHILRMK